MVGALESFFNPGKGFENAQQQAEKYYGQAQGFQQPYLQRGGQAGGILDQILAQYANPEQTFNQYATGYQESPYAKQQAERAKQEGLGLLSSMGLLGSTPGIQGVQGGITNVVNQGREGYLQHLFDLLHHGASLGENLYGHGASAANQAGSYAQQMGETSGNNAANAYAAPGQMFGGLLGAGATLAGSALRGPLGGALAGQLTKGWSTTGMPSMQAPKMPSIFEGYMQNRGRY